MKPLVFPPKSDRSTKANGLSSQKEMEFKSAALMLEKYPKSMGTLG
jgi:hypothetical protein